MGEEPWRVHVVGEPSLDAIATTTWLSDEELARRLGWEKDGFEPPVVATLHPATLQPESIAAQAQNLISALSDYAGLLVITAANHDAGGTIINDALRGFAARRPKTAFVHSLGWTAYASLLRRARAMIGNSSSGLLEAPSFELPVVNIGDRQRGRLRAANVIDVADEMPAIRAGLSRALSAEFRDGLRGLANPYSDGRSAQKIVDVLEAPELDERVRIKAFQSFRAK
jgi:UDP-hydrolysing UDP-N-acetyl-D-glucosamine 2-epimerase